MGCVLGCLPIVQPFVVPIITACCPPCAQHLWARCCPQRDTVDPMPGPSSGPKKSVMLISRTLKIEHSEKSDVWQWEEDENETRFVEVVKALGVTFLLIEASINFVRLSAETTYAAFLIYKTKADSEGLDALLVATVSVGKKNQWTKNVCLKPSSVGWPPNVKRSDNWMEMELGQFRCDSDTGKADISLKEIKVWKTGFTIAGIEVRPV